ncbi:MAG: NAD(+) synthase [Pirellulales bacterium]|nr:NAD(+) synthase [Pirellulales bacterium]
MKLIKVAAAVLNQTPLDWPGNKTNILAAIEAAREQGVSVLCLPELCISGYGCEDAFLSPDVQATSLDVLAEIVTATDGMIVSLGLPLLFNNALFNTACLVANGRILGFVGKQNLPGDGIHYEPRWFKPWPVGVRSNIRINKIDYAVGDIDFDCGGVKIGFEICEDAWVGDRPGGELSERGVDVILNPSASHFAFGKTEVRRRFVLEGSRAFGLSYIYSNLLGNEAGRAIYDGDAMIACNGKMLATGKRFSFENVQITTAIIDVELTRMARAKMAMFKPDFHERENARIEADFDFPEVMPEVQDVTNAAWESSPDVKEEEFTRSVRLALFDYMRKSHSRGFIVSLSGGADSAAVATLVASMVSAGIDELGFDGFRNKLSYIDSLESATDVRGAVKALLTCAYQGTQNSSEVTRNAAQSVADGLGADYMEFDVDALVQGYVDLVEKGLGRKLTWEQDDIALQNIQARVRAPSVWMLANVKGALLTATSNRSEAAVGYATMDGDTSGGLSPIAGIDKAFLRHWLRWMETTGPLDEAPVPVLGTVNSQQPTAELRPQAAEQTDEGDLMPYDLLDSIERLAIRDKHSPLEVFKLVRAEFAQYAPSQLGPWVERFFTLWCRNQWKRERYAPSFHLDDENLDPKTWCRFPILSGGYHRELNELREYVKQLG